MSVSSLLDQMKDECKKIRDLLEGLNDPRREDILKNLARAEEEGEKIQDSSTRPSLAKFVLDLDEIMRLRNDIQFYMNCKFVLSVQSPPSPEVRDREQGESTPAPTPST